MLPAWPTSFRTTPSRSRRPSPRCCCAPAAAPSPWLRSAPIRPSCRSSRCSRLCTPVLFRRRRWKRSTPTASRLFRTEITRSSDTAEALLRRLGIDDPAAAAFVRGNAEARTAAARPRRPHRDRRGHARKRPAEAERALDSRRRRRLQAPGDRARPQRGFRVRTETDALTPGSRLASGIVRSSLFAATDDARIPDAVASQLADIFSGDVDFRALRKGDRFAVVYETFEADGQTLRSGRVLSAEFESNGKLHQALWFQEPGQKGGYYRPNGKSLRQRLPGVAGRVLARHQRLRDAHAPHPQQLAPAQRHRLRARPPARRCAASATAWWSSPARRAATATS